MIDAVEKTIPFERLGHRAAGFRLAVEHMRQSLQKTYHATIIETGTARIRDNWEGDGQSTLVWDAIAAAANGQISVISIDLNTEAVEQARSQTKHVQYCCGDSVTVLSRLPEDVLRNTYLIYLDSFDWHDEINLDSAFHALSELASVYRLLPSGCMIMADDAHGPLLGKHWMVEHFLAKQQIFPVRKHYQFSWVLP